MLLIYWQFFQSYWSFSITQLQPDSPHVQNPLHLDILSGKNAFPLHNLILVAGHGVYLHLDSNITDESNWSKGYAHNHHKTWIKHIQKGVELADKDDRSLLLFSGGQTRPGMGPLTEAQSYWSLAEQRQWFGFENARPRSFTEEFAMDSFQNLLFSICRFREITGNYPRKITVISYEFKRRRFVTEHRRALSYPSKFFEFEGIDGDLDLSAFDDSGLAQAFHVDPFGCDGDIADKRERRNPYRRTLPYPSGCPEVADLFRICSHDELDHELPWEGKSDSKRRSFQDNVHNIK